MSTNNTPIESTRAYRFFWGVTAFPKTILFLSIAAVAFCAYHVPTMTRDTRSEAFIPRDHPAITYRDKVREIFGLHDPVLIAVVRDEEHGVFNPQTLELVAWLTEEVSYLDNVDPDRITSLATENDIFGDDFGMNVDPFYEYPPESQEEADRIRENVMDFPLYVGTLASRDGKATLIVAELLDPDNPDGTYRSFLDLVEQAPVENGEELHVAGEGAVAEYLGQYIDNDAQRLNPISALVITLILLVSYRTWRGVVLPNLIVLGTMAIALGTMAFSDVPFFVITNSLPVVLIAICVADAIHILSQYYEEYAHNPESGQRDLVVRAMVHMWRPVTFTSFTDVAGFLALGFSSFMPPMRFYGIFASLGVMTALTLSMFTLPAILVLLKPKQSPSFKNMSRREDETAGVDIFGRIMAAGGRLVLRASPAIVVLSLFVVGAGIWGALQMEFNEERMSVFQPYEPIRVADTEINDHLDGSNTLDIMVETPDTDALFAPENIQRVEALQKHIEALPHVNSSVSYVDYLKQMNRAMNEDRNSFYTAPQDADLAAQYFFLYEASADPTDFEDTIDSLHRQANIRAYLSSGRFSHMAPVVREMERYLAEEFNTETITGNLSGRVNVDFNWLRDLEPSHFKGVIVAMIAVWLMASASFRSFVGGFLATLPVGMALLSIYAVMGFTGIWLGIGTTMFSAIAIGVSVDFSIHTIDRLIALMREQGKGADEALRILFPTTGRALLFSGACMMLGFAVLLTSDVPPLNNFGFLVGVAVFISFLASMSVLPAYVKVFKPKFLRPNVHVPAAPDETRVAAVK